MSGRLAQVNSLKHDFERDENISLNEDNVDDVHAVAGLLKTYLRELPEPLVPISINERSEYSQITNEEDRITFARMKLRNLPKGNYETLQFLMEHLTQ